MRTGRAFWGSLLATAILGSGSPAGAVDVLMSVWDEGGTKVCDGLDGDVGGCDATGLPGAEITVTWSFDVQTVINGYDFIVSWDPGELTLVDWMLYPDPPPSESTVVPPDPAGSAECPPEAPPGSLCSLPGMFSLVPFSATALLSLTFEVGTSLPADGLADVFWWPNGVGLAPASVVLDNPEGAGIDLGENPACSDGLDNDGDGLIDADDPDCTGPTDPLEASDADDDGVADDGDNCAEVANGPLLGSCSAQEDTDDDGYGNACDADWANDDGIVGGTDFLAFSTAFGSTPGAGNWNPVVDSDCDNVISGNDFLLFSAQFGGSVGPSGLLCAGTIPCP